MKLGNNICPRCGVAGYGLFTKWVLNNQKKRYEPYYYFAHRGKDQHGHAKLKWCYIPRETVTLIREQKKHVKKHAKKKKSRKKTR